MYKDMWAVRHYNNYLTASCNTVRIGKTASRQGVTLPPLVQDKA